MVQSQARRLAFPVGNRFGEVANEKNLVLHGDVADAVVFLATRASFITGHVLAVDGGRCIVE